MGAGSRIDLPALLHPRATPERTYSVPMSPAPPVRTDPVLGRLEALWAGGEMEDPKASRVLSDDVAGSLRAVRAVRTTYKAVARRMTARSVRSVRGDIAR